MWWTTLANRCSNVAVDIYNGASLLRTVSIDQQSNGGLWNDLPGSYTFGGTARVVVRSGGSCTTCADAVRFVSSAGGGGGGTQALDRVTIEGPTSVNENSSTDYNLRASYTDGTSQWVEPGNWNVNCPAYGQISAMGLFTANEVSSDTACRISVSYAEGGITRNDTHDITIRNVTIASDEHIYLCFGYGSGAGAASGAQSWLRNLGATQQGSVWNYTNAQGKRFVFHIVQDIQGMQQALMTSGAHVLFRGHSNYGLGAVFATAAESNAKIIDDIYTIDDPRILNISSPWINVSVRGIRVSQSYPNWWPIFQDGTSGLMPYDFGDPDGDPPYNYYITYQIPGDSTVYRVESANFGAIQRFPDSGIPAWYSATGAKPNPSNQNHHQYFITNPADWSPSLDIIGNWISSSDLAEYFRDNYLYLPAGTGQNQVEYYFTVPRTGQYRVFAWWPAASTNTTGARYIVNHAGGSTAYTVNQRMNGGQWNQLGSQPFNFNAGEYSVIISDQATSGEVVADGIRVTAMDNPPSVIQADFNAEVRTGMAPLEVTFESTSTGDISSYQWNLGDGYTNSTRTLLTHTYTNAGTYNVSFTVSGPDGTSTRTKTGYIRVGSAAEPLRAEFTANGQQGNVPLTTSYFDVSSANAVSWAWDFDNNGTVDSTQQNPTHTYSNPGNYTVKLTVRTAGGTTTSTETKPNFVQARLMDVSLDNVDYPKTHYRTKTILFRKALEVPKNQMRYSRLYYEACNTGNYYLDTFTHGIVFYTINNSAGLGFYTYLQAYLSGRSDREIWQQMQSREPIYDYYDFNKLPSQQ
jgi:PKD repeat protein